MSTRRLSGPERHQAARVFADTIPYDKIALTGTSGVNDRPYTTPNGFPWDWESWDIHWGTQAEWDRKISLYGVQYYWDTLIHELTHVWQGHNSAFAPGYIFNSLWHQAVDSDAYAYTAGQPWGDYNAEQQAHLVEDWYHRGCLTSDPLFPYIRDHIRRRNP
jgi:hypothetical protein